MQQVRIRLLSNGFLAKMLFVLPFDTGDGRLPPCLTSWCNSDVESVLLCPSARCFLIKLSLCGVLFSVFFLSRIKMNLNVMMGVFLSFVLTSWCNSDVGSVLLCPWARLCFDKWLEGYFLLGIMMWLWCWECSDVPLDQMCFDMVIYMWALVFAFFLSHIEMQLWW